MEAAEEGGPWVGGDTENLTVSVQVQVAHGRPTSGDIELETRNVNQGDEEELVTQPRTASEQQLTSPVRGHVEVVTQPVRRPGSIQSRLTSSLTPLQPQLPNLALEALQRLAENSTNKDESSNDFRPLKKRKLAPETEGNCEDGEEVSGVKNGPLCTCHIHINFRVRPVQSALSHGQILEVIESPPSNAVISLD